MKNFKHLLQYTIIYLFFLISLILPMSLLSYLFNRFLRFIGPLIKISNIARQNIKICMPLLNDLEIEEIIKKLWGNIGNLLGELYYWHRMSDQEFNSHVTISDLPPELMEGNGLLLSAHYCNWEVIPRICSIKLKTDLNILYKIQSNKYFNKWLYKVRSGKHIKLINSGLGSLKKVATLLKKNQSIIMMLVDQRVIGGTKIDFFNKPALTTIAPVGLAMKYQVPIFISRVEQIKAGHYSVAIERLLIDYDKESPTDVMLRIHKKFEAWIVESPENWFSLLHNRWKI